MIVLYIFRHDCPLSAALFIIFNLLVDKQY